jgi:hypothetical protein
MRWCVCSPEGMVWMAHQQESPSGGEFDVEAVYKRVAAGWEHRLRITHAAVNPSPSGHAAFSWCVNPLPATPTQRD